MGKDKVSPKAILGDLPQVCEVATALNEAVKLIDDNRERIEAVEIALIRIDCELDSLERRYNELLFTFGDMKR